MAKIKKPSRYPCAVLFFILLFAAFGVDVIKPDASMSALENRMLNQEPSFSISSLLDDRWTRAYGEYARDQFVLRDEWMRSYSFIEQNALGKLEIGGVWLARDNYLMAKTPSFGTWEQHTLQTNIEAVNGLAERYPGKVYVMIVPSASNIMGDYLRSDPPRIDENRIMDEMSVQLSSAGVHVIDLRDDFRTSLAAGAQIYYRTDHHWTTDGGAYIAYEAFCRAVGRSAQMPDEGQKKTAEAFLGTNYSKSLVANALPDTLVYYDFPNQMYIEKGEESGEPVWQANPVVDYARLSDYDKYAAFLCGNNGYSLIDGNGGGSLVLIKDSYGNCFAPFLINNYRDVGIVDLRDRRHVSDIIDPESDILVLYSFSSFIQEQNLMWLKD